MDNESVLKRIKEIFGNMPDNFNVLEQQIDIAIQMDYFNYSKRVKKGLDPAEKINDINLLFEQELSIERKKILLAELASVEDVEAYRAIEKYLKNPDEQLKDFAVLALQESTMLLKSKLLDEDQIFISTGLGGKNSKLRYFIVFFSKTTEFSELHQRVVKNELDFAIKSTEIEIEEINYFDNIATILALIPLKTSIKDFFQEVIKECNQYGDFLKNNFLVTNVKKLEKQEIIELVNKHKKGQLPEME
jgi:hypothetical protein